HIQLMSCETIKLFADSTYPRNWILPPRSPPLPLSYIAPSVVCCRLRYGDCTHGRVAGAVSRRRDAGAAAARSATTLPRSAAALERTRESDGGARSADHPE